MAFGEAIVIATGEIDISVGSVSGIGALAFLGLAPIVGSGLALLAALACGILIGAMNGAFVALIGIPSLLVTLGSLFLFQGIGYAVTSVFLLPRLTPFGTSLSTTPSVPAVSPKSIPG
jgi:ribose/xylose/arabinose/galactoside ABC-type transport system permease subunit